MTNQTPQEPEQPQSLKTSEDESIAPPYDACDIDACDIPCYSPDSDEPLSLEGQLTLAKLLTEGTPGPTEAMIALRKLARLPVRS